MWDHVPRLSQWLPCERCGFWPPHPIPPLLPTAPPTPLQENNLRMSRRGVFGVMLGGSAAWWFALNGGVPIAAVDEERNVVLLKTKGGATVAATQVCSCACPACVAVRPEWLFGRATPAWGTRLAAQQGTVQCSRARSCGWATRVLQASRLPARLPGAPAPACQLPRHLLDRSVQGAVGSCIQYTALQQPLAAVWDAGFCLTGCATYTLHRPTSPSPQDAAGRVFLFDRAGNLYYDTEDPRLGMYIVSSRFLLGGGPSGGAGSGWDTTQRTLATACTL